MKTSLFISIILSMISSAAFAVTCKVTASTTVGGHNPLDLGQFESKREANGSLSGYFMTKSYDGGYAENAKKTGFLQVSLSQENEQKPYRIEMLLMSNERAIESHSGIEVNSLPVSFHLRILKMNKTNYPIPRESAGQIILSCSEDSN